jgi:hypothetical protein
VRRRPEAPPGIGARAGGGRLGLRSIGGQPDVAVRGPFPSGQSDQDRLRMPPRELHLALHLGEFLTGPEARATYASLFATVYTLIVNSLLLRVFSG